MGDVHDVSSELPLGQRLIGRLRSNHGSDPDDDGVRFNRCGELSVDVAGAKSVRGETEEALELFKVSADLGPFQDNIDPVVSLHLWNPRLA